MAVISCTELYLHLRKHFHFSSILLRLLLVSSILWLFCYQCAWFCLLGGPEQKGMLRLAQRGMRVSLPPPSFSQFCSWPCVLHMLQALCYFLLRKYFWILIPSFIADLSLKVLRLRSSYMKRNLLFCFCSFPWILQICSAVFFFFFYLTSVYNNV